MTRYIITKQIAVDAESPEDAVTKIANGKTVSFTVVERPPQPQMQMPQVTVQRPVLTPTPANP